MPGKLTSINLSFVFATFSCSHRNKIRNSMKTHIITWPMNCHKLSSPADFCINIWKNSSRTPIATIRPPVEFDRSNCKIECEISENGKLFFTSFTTDKSHPKKTSIFLYCFQNFSNSCSDDCIAPIELLSTEQKQKLARKSEQGF